MSDGLEIYKAMIEDTMQSIRPELVEALENYKVGVAWAWPNSFIILQGGRGMLTCNSFIMRNFVQLSNFLTKAMLRVIKLDLRDAKFSYDTNLGKVK